MMPGLGGALPHIGDKIRLLNVDASSGNIRHMPGGSSLRCIFYKQMRRVGKINAGLNKPSHWGN